jgi:hypothetical protein
LKGRLLALNNESLTILAQRQVDPTIGTVDCVLDN